MGHIQVSRRIPAQLSSVFDHMADPNNIPGQFSGLIEMQVVLAAEKLQVGSTYRIKMSRYGVAQEFEYEIDEVQRNNRISFRLIAGPLKTWRHSLRFAAFGHETQLQEFVEYELPMGVLGYVMDDLYARAELRHVLEYRLDRIFEHFKNLKEQV